MTPKRTEDRADLFHVALDRVINLDHPLAKLAEEFDWDHIRPRSSRFFAIPMGVQVLTPVS